jgi:4a-hydroxytetrahydrobiopterin dehydratase
MTTLARERCTACRRDSPSVTAEEITELHPQAPEWELMDPESIPKLDRSFTFRNFAQALDSPTGSANWLRTRGTIRD